MNNNPGRGHFPRGMGKFRRFFSGLGFIVRRYSVNNCDFVTLIIRRSISILQKKYLSERTPVSLIIYSI